MDGLHVESTVWASEWANPNEFIGQDIYYKVPYKDANSIKVFMTGKINQTERLSCGYVQTDKFRYYAIGYQGYPVVSILVQGY